jgi:hypothetical protein
MALPPGVVLIMLRRRELVSSHDALGVGEIGVDPDDPGR